MMMDREKTCCFTGHRPDKLPWGENERDPRCVRLKQSIAQAVEDAYTAGIRHFITGMARGCDLYCAEAEDGSRYHAGVRPPLRNPGGQLACIGTGTLPVHLGAVQFRDACPAQL